jgi:DNA polymerase III subunit delta
VPETPAVALFWGEDEFLLRQAALELLEAHGLRATEIDASDWRGGELFDLATPSLWGERRALLVSGCQHLPEQGARELRSYIEAPSPDAICVMTLVTRGKSPALAKVVQGARGLARQVGIRRQDLPKWILERARARDAGMTPAGAAALVATLGEDPATLDQAVEQLARAFPGKQIGPDHVHAQFEGLGEQRVWDLCDRAFSGNVSQALVVLRSLLAGRDDPLLILGGIASRLRDLLRVQSLPDRIPPAEAAQAAGLRFDWQVRRYREQARRYTPEEMADLHSRVVESDRALKGGAAGDVVLAALVAAISGERRAALDVPIRVSR